MVFKRKRKVKVYSDVFNLAGDIKNRANYLKTIIIDQVLHNEHPSMGAAIQSGYLKGPGIKLRTAVPYAERKEYFNVTGQNKATLKSTRSIDVETLKPELENILGFEINLIDVDIDVMDIDWWALQWIQDNHPADSVSMFEAEYLENTNQILIEFYHGEDDEKPYKSYTFDGSDFKNDLTGSGDFMYVEYSRVREPEVLSKVEYPELIIEKLPNLKNYSLNKDRTTKVNKLFEWENTVHIRDVYIDDEGNENIVEETQIEKAKRGAGFETYFYESTTLLGSLDEPEEEGILEEITKKVDTISIQYRSKLVPRTIVEEPKEYEGFTRYITRRVFLLEPEIMQSGSLVHEEVEALSQSHIYIYQAGSGNKALDTIFESSTRTGQYFPFIPIKTDVNPGTKARQVFIDRDDMDNPSLNGVYSKNRDMVRKIAGRKSAYDDIISSLKENEDIDKVNYAYIFYGTPINTPDNSAKKYLFTFFKELGYNNPEFRIDLTNYNLQVQQHEESKVAQERWRTWYGFCTTDNYLGIPQPQRCNNVSPMPKIIPYPYAPVVSLSLRSTGIFNLNYQVTWNGVDFTEGKGKLIPDMRVGEVRVRSGGTPSIYYTSVTVRGEMDFTYRVSNKDYASTYLEFIWQKGIDNWESVKVSNIQSKNLIHRGKSISLRGREEINNSDESGLIIPLNEAIFKSMGLKDSTQFATSCMYLMINYYTDVKQKWYQTGVFKIFIVVAAIVVSVASMGGASGFAASGVGAVLATAVGATGLAAAIITAVTNAIAGIIVAKIATAAATKVFGDKIGIIVGAIVATVVIGAMGNIGSGQPFNILDSFNAIDLIKLTDSIATGLTNLEKQEIGKIHNQMQEDVAYYKKESERLNSLIFNEFGDRGRIEMDGFLRKAEATMSHFESPAAFLERTLMTGSDISDISMAAIEVATQLEHNIQLS